MTSHQSPRWPLSLPYLHQQRGASVKPAICNQRKMTYSHKVVTYKWWIKAECNDFQIHQCLSSQLPQLQTLRSSVPDVQPLSSAGSPTLPSCISLCWSSEGLCCYISLSISFLIKVCCHKLSGIDFSDHGFRIISQIEGNMFNTMVLLPAF